MGTFSIWHWLIVLVVVLVLFGGGGKIPKLMRDMGLGINAFKKGLKESEKDKAADKDKLDAQKATSQAIDTEPAAAPAAAAEDKDKAVGG